MIKFIFKFFIFFSLVTLFIGALFAFNKSPIQDNDYMAAIVDKHAHLDSIKTPRIIFAGGSNLAFGLDSKKIEETFQYPVVNLGLHAGLGLKFILNEVKYSIHANDVVFLSIEYLLSMDGNNNLRTHTSNIFPDAKKYYQCVPFISDIEYILNKDRKFLRTIIKGNDNIGRETSNSIYARNSFNTHGDVVAHLEKSKPTQLDEENTLVYEYWEGIAAINELSDYAKSKNVKLYFLYPNYPISEYRKNMLAINLYCYDLNKDLKVNILNKPTDFLYKDDNFFDSVYHLNRIGRAKRTEKMISILRSVL